MKCYVKIPLKKLSDRKRNANKNFDVKRKQKTKSHFLSQCGCVIYYLSSPSPRFCSLFKWKTRRHCRHSLAPLTRLLLSATTSTEHKATTTTTTKPNTIFPILLTITRSINSLEGRKRRRKPIRCECSTINAITFLAANFDPKEYQEFYILQTNFSAIERVGFWSNFGEPSRLFMKLTQFLLLFVIIWS